jgi:flagellar motor switch/type III secretory pathway protein FliN
MMASSTNLLTTQLPRYSAHQRRFVACCADPEVRKLVPLGAPSGCSVSAVAQSETFATFDGLRIAWRAPDEQVHLDTYLSEWDLLALGLSAQVWRHAPVNSIASLLSPLLRPLLEESRQQVSRLLRCEVALGMQRLDPRRGPAEVLPRFLATGVPRLGRLSFGVSPTLISACEAVPWSPAVAEAAQHVPLEWEVQASCGALARDVQRNLAVGDVVRTPLPSIADVEAAVALVANMQASTPHSAPIPRRQLKLAIDRWGWIRTKFEGREMSDSTDENMPIDQLTVPITLHLPLSSMSLLEISRFTPGWLVETGIRIHDVEVSLSTAGQRFAFGRLVAIGDQLGVQITRVGNSQ